jgi:hypothetical protein
MVHDAEHVDRKSAEQGQSGLQANKKNVCGLVRRIVLYEKVRKQKKLLHAEKGFIEDIRDRMSCRTCKRHGYRSRTSPPSARTPGEAHLPRRRRLPSPRLPTRAGGTGGVAAVAAAAVRRTCYCSPVPWRLAQGCRRLIDMSTQGWN